MTRLLHWVLSFAFALAALITALEPAVARHVRPVIALARPSGPCSGRLVFATWYAIGHRTASGKVFDPGGHTAAHRTLPFGSQVTVQNPRNGQSVTVLINDRGPYRGRAGIDLSRGAAQAIGMRASQWVCML
jgi:rare lipoprotein A